MTTQTGMAEDGGGGGSLWLAVSRGWLVAATAVAARHRRGAPGLAERETERRMADGGGGSGRAAECLCPACAI
jgi:hypothetical protein